MGLLPSPYVQPSRTPVPSYPTIAPAREIQQTSAGLATTSTVRTENMLISSPPVRQVPTLGVRADGTVGSTGLPTVQVTDPSAGISRVAPLGPAVGDAREQDAPRFIPFIPLGPAPAEQPQIGAAEDADVPPTSIESSSAIPGWLWLAGGVAGVALVGFGIYSLTR